MKIFITPFFILFSLFCQAQDNSNNINILQDKISQYEKLGDTISLKYMITLDDLGESYYRIQNYSEAEKYFLKSLKLKKEILGEKHIEYAYSLHNLGSFYGERGQYLEAEPLLLKALEIRVAILGKKNKVYLKTLENIAIMYAKQGKYSQAEPFFLEVLDIKKSIFGETNPDYIGSLQKLAFFYQSQGNFYQAEPQFLKVLEIKKDIFGENHLEYANSLDDLGMLYYYQDKYSKAEIVDLKALEIKRVVLGEKHSEYIFTLNNLGTVYIGQKKYNDAEALYIKILENEKLSGEKLSESYMNNLAFVYEEQKKYTQAESLYLETLQLKKELLGKKNNSYGITLKNLALLYRKQGKYTESESLLLESLEIKRETLGEKHPDYLMNLLNLAVLYRIVGLNEKSSQYFEQFSKSNHNRLFDDFYFMSEKELIDYVNSQKNNLFSPLSFLNDFSFQYPEINISSFENELLLKNLSLRNTQRIRNSIQKSDNNSLKVKYEKILENKKKIRVQEELLLDNSPEIIASLLTETDQIEKELTKESATFSQFKKSLSINWNQVKLKKHEAVIDLVAFDYYKKKRIDSESKVYGAFIVKKDSKFPKFISLFEGKQLDSLLLRNKSIIASTRINNQYEDKAISDLFLKPLEKELQGITTIYLSPTGLGHQIDFSALPITGNQTLGEKYNLHILNSPAELIDYKVANLDKKSNLELILYGGIDYDKSNSLVKSSNDLVENSETLKELQTRTGIAAFGYLSGTKKEVEQIQLKGTQNGFKTTLLNDSAATEESIKQLDGRTTPFVLHLATHGFFFPDPKEEISNDLTLESEKRKIYKASDDPMMRSGLLLAGANNYWGKTAGNTTTEDGILTASEISNLDLSACQLVVLSACETGLGEVKGSEGVFGLQRAFKMAGVKNIIMSLWKVPDAQTAELFEIFYGECFAGKTIHEAFQTAQAKMRVKYSPYYWAGFVLLE